MTSHPETLRLFMPLVGNHPAPEAKITMRPSQKLGTDHSVRATPVWTRSAVLPWFHAPLTPSHRPSSAEMITLVPTSSTVGHSRSPISSVTGRRYWNEAPHSGQVAEELFAERLVQAEAVPQRVPLLDGDGSPVSHGADRIAGDDPE